MIQQIASQLLIKLGEKHHHHDSDGSQNGGTSHLYVHWDIHVCR